MTFEGIGFNSEWVASHSLAEVMEHEKHHGLSPEQFAELHKLCRQKHPQNAAAKMPKQVSKTEEPAAD